MESDITNEDIEPKNKSRAWILVGVIITLFIIFWIAVRPGIFVIQPIGALPDGAAFIYHSRSSEMPFFGSPDGMCLEMYGSVTLLCRMGGISAGGELTERKIVTIPYMGWMYLRSTGGAEFDE